MNSFELQKKRVLAILAALIFFLGAGVDAHAQEVDSEQVFLNLENIKQELKSIQRETQRLTLLARDDFRREIAILKRELKETQDSLRTELRNFQKVNEKVREESQPIIEKFKKDVEELTLLIRQTLEHEQEIFAEQQGISRKAGEDSFNNVVIEKEAFQSRSKPPKLVTKDAFADAKLNLPRVKTVDPSQPLVFDQFETKAPEISTTPEIKESKTPTIDLDDLLARLEPKELKFNDQSVEIPSLYDPKAYPIDPGPKGLTKLERYQRALNKYSKRIKGTKSLLSEATNPHPLWLNLGKTYLDTEHYLQSLHPTDRIEVMESDEIQDFALGGYQSALLAYKNALRLQPGDGDTNLAMGDIYDEIHEGASAINHMHRARYLYERNNEKIKAKVASAKLRVLREKYQKIRVCDGTGPDEEGCWLQVPRTEVGPGEFKNNARFYQKGIPPKSPYGQETRF